LKTWRRQSGPEELLAPHLTATLRFWRRRTSEAREAVQTECALPMKLNQRGKQRSQLALSPRASIPCRIRSTLTITAPSKRPLKTPCFWKEWSMKNKRKKVRRRKYRLRPFRTRIYLKYFSKNRLRSTKYQSLSSIDARQFFSRSSTRFCTLILIWNRGSLKFRDSSYLCFRMSQKFREERKRIKCASLCMKR